MNFKSTSYKLSIYDAHPVWWLGAHDVGVTVSSGPSSRNNLIQFVFTATALLMTLGTLHIAF